MGPAVLLDITKASTYRLAYRMLTHPYVVPILVGHFCHATSHFVALSWLPTYYHEVSTDAASSKAAVIAGPYACMAFFSVAAAHVADWLLKRGTDRTRASREERERGGGGGLRVCALYVCVCVCCVCMCMCVYDSVRVVCVYV